MISTRLAIASAHQSSSAIVRNSGFGRATSAQNTPSTSRQAQTASASSQGPMAPKKGKFAKPTRAAQPRPTHFVCLPLANEASVPQLKESMAKFRQITTSIAKDDAPPKKLQRRYSIERMRPWNLPEQQLHPQDEQHNATSEPAGQMSNAPEPDYLRKIPAEAHRPPGTIHLTLGVMDLSEQKDMERALQLLQDIDYVDFLRQAESKALQERAVGDKIHGETGSSTSLLKSLDRAISPPPLSSFSSSSSSSPSKSNDASIPNPGLPTPITLTLQGLGSFPLPRSSRAFFAQPHDPSERLQTFAELVRHRFMAVGLITETRPLVLHATIANLIYAKGSRKDRGRKGAEVDGQGILKFFNGQKGDDDAAKDPSRSAGASDSVVKGQSPSSPTTLLHPRSSSTNPGDEHQSHPQIWAREITIDRIQICKMGAEPCDIPDWGLEYKPIGERRFLP